uniref:E2 domain-containing protein n=1 Tax=Heterorhabditis bacteriophora TaxID=37862 RepID=A0A1I7XNP2_HETBA
MTVGSLLVASLLIQLATSTYIDEDDDDDDYEEEYDDSDDDSDEKSLEGQDPYFKTNEPENEHENFKDAEERLDKKHREKIDKVMKEWGELEARYQEMKQKDSKGAETFKISMTNRFQKVHYSLFEFIFNSYEAYEKLHPTAKLDVKAPPTTTENATVEPAKLLPEDSHDSEEDDDEYYEDEDDEEVKKTVTFKKPKVKIVDIQVKKEDKVPKVVEKSVQTDPQTNDDSSDSDEDSGENDEESTVKELRVDIEPIIEEKPTFYRHEKLILRHENLKADGGVFAFSQAVFLMGIVVLISLSVLVITIIRRRRVHHGFIELIISNIFYQVDVYTPEERHVAGMQVNGYENPTYSFLTARPKHFMCLLCSTFLISINSLIFNIIPNQTLFLNST